MTWQSYVLPLIGSALLSTFTFFLGILKTNFFSEICFFPGKWDYSVVWVLVIVILSVTKSFLWRKRERRLISLRATALREREVIMAQLQDLPAWVQFPDTERVEWMNKVIHQLWPYVGEYTKTFMNDFIIPQVKAQMPGMFKNFKFTKMDMGDIPCRVGGIKVYTTNVGRDRIIVDMDVAYAGDADFTVSCCGFTGGMNNIQFSGKLRAILKPLLPYPPMVGGVSGTFLEMPKMDFNLTGMGEMVELPGLIDAIRSVINSQIAALCVLPNEIVVPLAPDVDVTKLYFPEPDGVVRLKVIEAKNLENRDISFIKKGKSDPYAEIQVGSQFFKTRTIDDDLNPIWNEYFEAVVDQADGQKLRIELFDEDQGKDEELGRLSVDLKMVQAKGTVDKWYPLEGCKHGDLHLKATWMSLSTDLKHLERQEWEAEWGQADKPIHSALLMVYIDSVADLPYPKSKLEPSPFVEVSLGKETQRTPVKVKTVNPLFQSKFMFFVRHLEGQELKFEAVDDGTRRSLGTLNIPLTTLMKEPKLEQNQQMHMLTLGVHQSPIVITTRIRILRSDSNSSLNSHGRSNSRLGRLFRSKHEMKKRETRADENRGEIEIRIDFDELVNQLKIAVIRCRDLMTFDKKDQCNPYVSVKLVALDGHKEVFKKKTPTAKNTRNPHFDNHVEIDVNPSDLLNHKVVINVKDDTNYGTFVAKPVLGCLEIRLDSLLNRQLSQRWIPLSVERK
ncbi:Protein CBR-ESYT-2 [Caenorhabditis briggsae]|uniref:Protein CBR-ESYT-2 n=1 Tax=Caenorhabditis briggsae TaxID=6238 RepID=A8XR22_CAEBR|nr:Protein CBR-ESYT-2 [Caenorhabditis briggsae]CAP35095.2 Protein CBR-ESYT-2 [Caenorhabditis briggsae]